MPSELEAILEQPEIRNVEFRSACFDLGDDGHEFMGSDCIGNGALESVYAANCGGSGNAGRASDTFQIGFGGRCCGEPPHGEEAFVVKNDGGGGFGGIASHGAE